MLILSPVLMQRTCSEDENLAAILSLLITILKTNSIVLITAGERLQCGSLWDVQAITLLFSPPFFVCFSTFSGRVHICWCILWSTFLSCLLSLILLSEIVVYCLRISNLSYSILYLPCCMVSESSIFLQINFYSIWEEGRIPKY